MSEVAGKVALTAYGFLGLAFRPVLPVLLERRARRGKEVAARLGERYGIAGRDRPPGDLIWVHAASVGEVNAAMELIGRLAGTGRPLLLTTATVTGSRVAAAKLPPGAVHQFVPYDITPYVDRFLAHWRPTLAIFVESELWPYLTTALDRRGVPLVVANGRISSRSVHRWRRFPSFARAVFGRITLCLARGAEDAVHFTVLGAPRIEETGNLKFDLTPPGFAPEQLADLAAAIGERPVFLAASTHPGEDEAVAEAHGRIAVRHPGLLTVIAPRHPERGPSIAARLTATGHTVALRSAGEPIDATTDIYVADTLGELGLFFRLAPIVFMGGSLIRHGGQNPIEPIALGAAVVHGPHVDNFDGVYLELGLRGQADRVTDAASLAATVAGLLDDPQGLARRRADGPASLTEFKGALDRTWTALQPFLARRGGLPGAGEAAQ